MTDTPTGQEQTDRRRLKIINGILISGWIMTLITMIAIVGCAVYFMFVYPTQKLPDMLGQWASLALGFLFGGFVNIVRDFMDGK